MALEETIAELRDSIIGTEGKPVPSTFQGVSKSRIKSVLEYIDRYSVDQVDVVFALLDNVNDSWFTRAPQGTKFCLGASCH